MFELLQPAADSERITQLIGSTGYDFVDAWIQAKPELRQLDQLEHVDPSPRPASIDLNDDATVEAHSSYAIYPWRRTIVRLPESDIFYRLKSARNRHLLTYAEQEAWQHATIAVAGLSVGSAALIACGLTGARKFHVADPDDLAITNLNRLAGSVCDLGRSKLELARRRLLEADPYTALTAFAQGYAPDIAAAFLGTDADAVQVVIEEIDDVAMKIDMRRRARAAGIPVVSATDIGDNVVLDIERFDLDPAYPIFHGRGENFADGDADDPTQRLSMAAAIVGDSLTPRMAFSASQINRSISSWPQLGSTAQMAGALAATAARMIVCRGAVPSGRYHIEVDRILLDSAADGTGAWNELEPSVLAAMIAGARVDTAASVDSP
ncbi:thiamine biosynthesis protein ThiF [Gordonia sp. TBRC 11910]|uniref:Thiamine biosynthesis protein ThiF n=1 Tax=Gordonia asplenii TaxID=2725283 RepID=A0A848KSS8_9ACTN|nr:ThiF family adenylyltransferase [Gordonia asplenii]NMO01209.1 thiamine biosynthesis protein ThiF [Gordonia asplenii]